MDPISILIARAESRALLWRCCELSYEQAVDPLWKYAHDSNVVDTIGEMRTVALIESYFRDR